ncbi:TPA: hypothetical protein ACPJ00_003254 [Vibrio diabolicus]|uniref:hypothetical protein n=2 Tax=Vibrio diabolicus TaxID=50719 RepID=UPI002940600E|nr:hypothetical protein [Vibrio diabolicus]MDV5085866.1 hypothetical protein [Vibrio diabolicus]
MIIVFFYILFSVTALNSPVTVYGTQIIGFFSIFLLSISLRMRINIGLNLLFVGIFLVILFTTKLNSIYGEYTGILWLNAMRSSFWVFIAFNLYAYIKHQPKDYLERSLKIIILISVFFVYTQFVSFYVFHFNFDLSTLLGGEPARSGSGHIYRPVGLTTEPAIHSGFMLGMLTLYYICRNKVDSVVMLGLSSLFLSMSVFGIIAALIFIVVTCFNFRSYVSIIIGLLLLITSFYFVFDILQSRLDLFLSGGDGSNNVKVTILKDIIYSNVISLIGFGFVGKAGDAPLYYEALYDMTLPINLIVLFGLPIGLIALAVIFVLFIKLQFDLRSKALIALTLLKVSSLTSIFFPCFVCILYCLNNHKLKSSLK